MPLYVLGANINCWPGVAAKRSHEQPRDPRMTCGRSPDALRHAPARVVQGSMSETVRPA
jgi:hypothetical protein